VEVAQAVLVAPVVVEPVAPVALEPVARQA
jgi:hypothetical protein